MRIDGAILSLKYFQMGCLVFEQIEKKLLCNTHLLPRVVEHFFKDIWPEKE